jgi:molybdopterin synthase sulfur carrier subunit
MSSKSIKIQVKLFAIYQEIYRQDQLEWELPSPAKVSDVLDRILLEHPELQKWRSLTRYGVNLQFVEENTLLQNGDEVVLIPPVSGG